MPRIVPHGWVVALWVAITVGAGTRARADDDAAAARALYEEGTRAYNLGEYEKVDGLYFPFEIGRTHLDAMELNVPVDASRFAFPEGGR